MSIENNTENLTAILSAVNNLQNFVDIMYPVGSIFMSTKATHPNDLFGGGRDVVAN